MRHANRRRGEVEATIAGEKKILCLTFGALAELETALNVDNIADLVARLSAGRLSARDMIAILGAGLRGGGNVVDDDDIAVMSLDGGVEEAIRLVASLLAAAFLPDSEALARP